MADGVTTYVYDQANRLVSYGLSATYAYDGDGLRTQKKVAGRQEPFTWDAAGREGGAPQQVVTGAQTVEDILSGLAAGQSSGVRVVGSADEMTDLFAGLSRGGSQIESTYLGKLIRLPDGTTVGLRGTSRSGVRQSTSGFRMVGHSRSTWPHDRRDARGTLAPRI